MARIKTIDGTAVRCQAGSCDLPALFLIVGNGTSAACWAYCPEHATQKASELNLELPELPEPLAATAAAW